VEAFLRAARPVSFDGDILTLEVFYRFHKEQLEQEPYRSILEDSCSRVIGRKVKVSCLLAEKEKRPKKENLQNVESTRDEDIIKAAQDIFGGKVVN